MPSPPALAGGVSYLQQLYHCPQRLSDARDLLGEQLDEHLASRTVRVVQSVLGPLVTLNTQGLRALGHTCKPLSCATVTDQLAAREAYALAQARGYKAVHVSRSYLRLRDSAGREHLLYVRVSLGLPTVTAIRSLLKKHAPSLRRTGGTVIFYVLSSPDYQGRFGHALQFWVASSSPPSAPAPADTAPAFAHS